MKPLKLASALVGASVLFSLAGAPALPVQAKDAAGAVASSTMWVWVHSDGRITCDGQTLSLAELQQRVKELPPKVQIRIGADPDATFDAVGKVVAVAQRHIGIVGFITGPSGDTSK